MLTSQYPGLVFPLFLPTERMEEFWLNYLLSGLPLFLQWMPFFYQVFLGTFAWIKALCFQRCQFISWDAVDVFHSFSTTSSSKQPLPPTPTPAPSAPWPPAPSHRVKHPCSSSDGTLPIRIATCLSFPAPLCLETLHCTSCPSCLKAGFCLLRSARATKPLLSAKVAGCPLHPLYLVQKAAGRGRSMPGAGPGASCPHCGAGGQRTKLSAPLGPSYLGGSPRSWARNSDQ